jgi:hypothetical protein
MSKHSTNHVWVHIITLQIFADKTLVMRSVVQSRMFEIIGKKSPSQDVASFCAENNIAKASYYYWLKKYRDQNVAVSDGNGFTPIALIPSNGALLLSLQLPSGHVINVFHCEAFSFIESLLS